MRDDLIRDIEQFLYHEARLLDARRLSEWLDLFTDDVRYWMPVRSTRYPRNSKAISILDGERYESEELAGEKETAILDEDKASLEARIKRLDTGMAWAEDPPSRTRHIITNIELEAGESDSELKVFSNYLVYRSRGETEQDFFIGAREDILRQVAGQWKIARRKIILDQTVLLAKNVSIFF